MDDILNLIESVSEGFPTYSHNIIFGLRIKKYFIRLYNPRYCLVYGCLPISKFDRMIINLRGFLHKRELVVLQSKFIDGSNLLACCKSKKAMGMKLRSTLA